MDKNYEWLNADNLKPLPRMVSVAIDLLGITEDLSKPTCIS